MNLLSSEILKVNQFAKILYTQKNNEKVINFLISLDFLIKGILSHWQIKLNESEKVGSKKNLLMKGMDVKFPLLIGDQYHTIAYYIVTRLGNIELVRILTLIEENFQKVFFSIDPITSNFRENLILIYNHFYNYLPQFMGNSLKGVALIFELDQELILEVFDTGIELGFFYQFGVFSYIMTAIINQTEKQKVKEHLKRISNILQYLSFETIEKIMYEMQTYKIKKLQTEFLMLTHFHGD